MVYVQTAAYQQHRATGVADQTWTVVLQEGIMTTLVLDKNHNWTIVSTITDKNAVPIRYPNARIVPDDAGDDLRHAEYFPRRYGWRSRYATATCDED